MRLSHLITNSRLKTYQSCARRHYFQYELGYKPRARDDNLHLGTLIHLALEAWWKAHGEGKTPDERLAASLAALQREDDPFLRVKAEEMILGYEIRWGNEQYAVLFVEAEFSGELINPDTGAASRTWEIAGKLDVGVLDFQTQRKLIVEHKTTSESLERGSNYWLRLRIDPQISIYFEGARLLGHEVDACIYDVLSKPSVRPQKATPLEARRYTKPTAKDPVARLYAGQREEDETPEEYRIRVRNLIAENPDRYYQRGEVVRLEEEKIEAARNTWELAKQILENGNAGRYPQNPGSCEQYGRLCAFFSVCTREGSLDDESRFDRVDWPHSELVQIRKKPKEAA